MKGTVRWFNNAMGYGFISCEGSPDVFIHFAAIQQEEYRSLFEGEAVDADLIRRNHGPQLDQRSQSDHDRPSHQGPQSDQGLPAEKVERMEDS